MTYRTTRRCDHDIVEIYVHGAAAFGIDHAERYHVGLMETFSLLSLNPGIARLRSDISPPVRLHRYKAHMIAYAEHNGEILFLRVLHGRQDWERHLT